jgi:hypothetical protein
VKEEDEGGEEEEEDEEEDEEDEDDDEDDDEDEEDASPPNPLLLSTTNMSSTNNVSTVPLLKSLLLADSAVLSNGIEPLSIFERNGESNGFGLLLSLFNSPSSPDITEGSVSPSTFCNNCK